MSSVAPPVLGEEAEPLKELRTHGRLPGILQLRPAVQRYAWGDPQFIPALLGETHPDGRPCAELWMGAHSDAPAGAVLGGSVIPLDRLLNAAPEEILHPAVAARFGRQLPFLFKVLAAAAPLSLQTHPSKRNAEEGFARENQAGLSLGAPERNFRDANHKPELIVALTDFYGLRGFRRLSEIARQIEEVPQLREAVVGFRPTVESLQGLYAKLMSLPPDKTDALLTPLVEQLAEEHRCKPFTKADREFWILSADKAYSRQGHRDPGLFSFYLLNLVHLAPGEGMYLPAGILHAYLEGAGVELMANSNNVLRGGLTTKHIDVPELLRNVTFDDADPEIVRGRRLAGTEEWVYPTPAAEFQLSRIDLDESASHTSRPDHPVEILLLVSAVPEKPVTIRADGETRTIKRGEVFLAPYNSAYELSSTGPATVFKATVPLASPIGSEPGAAEDQPLFRGRKPTALAFGTSGLRGLVADITDLEAYINTRGFLEFLRGIGEVDSGQPVSLAGDLRPSSDGAERSIMRAVARAIVDAGLSVDHLGKLPTPALTYYAVKQRRPSIMVTGSHIPFDRNGIKFNKRTGEVLKADEPAILEAVSRARAIEYARDRRESLFGDDGMFKDPQPEFLSKVNSQAWSDYLGRYLNFLPENVLNGQRIIVYQHSAVGRDLLIELLTTLGAEAIPMARSESFVPVDTEAISTAQMEFLQLLADQAGKRYGPLDAIVSTDGDSDRPLLAGIDSKAKIRFFSGDLLGIVTADFLKTDSVVVPISVNDAVDRWAAERKIPVRKTRIGSPHVIEAMQQVAARGAGRVVGWEANGGFLTGTDIERAGRLLKALPTRDAALPLLAALCSAKEQAVSLTELFARLPHRFSKAGLIDKFPPEISQALVRHFSASDPDIHEVEFTGDSVNFRHADGRVEPATAAAARSSEATRLELEQFFGPKDGFGRVERINTLDGLRVWFSNGDIAHVRPSGNAPQLRIYAVADNLDRVEQIVALGLREPDGILRNLEFAAGRCAAEEKTRANQGEL